MPDGPLGALGPRHTAWKCGSSFVPTRGREDGGPTLVAVVSPIPKIAEGNQDTKTLWTSSDWQPPNQNGIGYTRGLMDISHEAYRKYRDEVETLTKRIEEAKWCEITTKNYEILNKIIGEYEEDIIKRKEQKIRKRPNRLLIG
ncbi:hypothetical protein NDU88_008869 [Pleurodeles waltl]|uniref:Uncharacterized protein n=1 Tax=Pleurodeles waltl TaxID=8319 RepID=A0AAV7QTS2_PLEWA|nr:hypothetical protein NDU88_008869 [Pleurodeles waltl]